MSSNTHKPAHDFSITINIPAGALEEDSAKFLEDALRRFCAKAVPKFIRGQKEHGGFIADRPMLPELENELVDAWDYTCGAMYRSKKILEFLEDNLTSEQKAAYSRHMNGHERNL